MAGKQLCRKGPVDLGGKVGRGASKCAIAAREASSLLGCIRQFAAQMSPFEVQCNTQYFKKHLSIYIKWLFS